MNNKLNKIIMVGVVVGSMLPSLALADDATSTPVSNVDTSSSSTPVSTVTPPSSDSASSTPVSTPSKPKPTSKSGTVLKDGSSTKPKQTTVASTPVSISAPSAVSNLTITSVSPKSIDLAWNVPQSQAVVTGFDIRMSTKPIDSSNFDSAIQLGGVGGGVTGAKVTATATDLPPKTKIYFAVKAQDQAGGVSNISNVISGTTGTVVNSNANSVVDQSSQFTPAQDISKQQASTDDGQNNNTPAQVKLTILMPDQSAPTTPIFVNFVNTATGVSYGGPAVGGIASYVVPPGNYTVKIITTDPLLTVPDLAGFSISSGEIKQLDSVVLGQLANDPELDSLNQNQSIGFGYIIKLLGKIILMLEQILAKLNSK
jgi:hypothetical protein